MFFIKHIFDALTFFLDLNLQFTLVNGNLYYLFLGLVQGWVKFYPLFRKKKLLNFYDKLQDF